jgi:hypothetical protein
MGASRLGFGANNVFDKLYYHSLGGIDWAQTKYNNPSLSQMNFNQAERSMFPARGAQYTQKLL